MRGIPRRKEEIKNDKKENRNINVYYFSLALLILFGIYLFFPGSAVLESTTDTPTFPRSSPPDNILVSETSISPKVDKVRIILLHGNHRCTSCINMEAWTEETIETYFSEEREDEKIEFLVLNYQDPQNDEIVSRYSEHPFTSLYAEIIIGGESHITEMEDAWYYQTEREKFIMFMKEYIDGAIGDV